MKKMAMTNFGELGDDKSSLSPVLTPVSEQGIRTLFEGLAAVHDTSVLGAPAAAAIAITPSLFSLLMQFCGTDPRFDSVMANIWPMEYSSMKEHYLREGEVQFEVRVRPQAKKSLIGWLWGRS